MDQNTLPPKSEWTTLSLNQLYDLRNKMVTLFWNMKDSGASYANQYALMVSEIDALIAKAEVAALQPPED